MSVDRDITLQPHPIASAAALAEAADSPVKPEEADFYQYESNLVWMNSTPETAEESEADYIDNESQQSQDFDSLDFVLSRGHITPNNLLPGWDDEEEGPWGPRKGYYTQPIRRSGELTTFDERLHEVGASLWMTV